MNSAMIRNPQTPPSLRLSIAGFSLVELMVAVAIIAILAVIAVPAFQDMIVQSRLSAQANDLVSAIQAARGEAIKRNLRVDFCRTSSATSTDCAGAGSWEFWIARINTTATVLRRGSINPELRLSSTFNQGRITFLPDGTSTITAGSDTLTACSPTGSGNTTRVITVGIAGRTSVTKTTGSCS